MALTPSQVTIVKSTAAVLKDKGGEITRIFYANMLAAHPELRNLFSLRNQATGAQQAALGAAVLAYAAYIDDLPRLQSAVERIAHKHASLFVRPEQYAIVGEHLVGAFAEVLGDALTPEVADAWTAAYAQLADVFIGRERALYEEPGAWQDWRDFAVAEREEVSEGVVSFYLKPADGGRLPRFLPGQYVSLQIPIPELGGLLQSRQYSLSAFPNAEGEFEAYRVTIKMEPATAGADPNDVRALAAGSIAGIVGNRLHARYNVGDTVQLSSPRGEFVFDAARLRSPSSPVVLLSAGVGATPLLSMLDAIRGANDDLAATGATTDTGSAPRPVVWAHAARNANAVCYGKHVRQAAEDADADVTAKVFLSNVAETDVQGVDYDYKGRFDVGVLVADGVLPLAKPDAEYFLCGPKDWMIQVRDDLKANNVSHDNVHLELFSTGDV
ncbi:flavohemoprotein [Cordyceps fumosorosea ARSEF 2679]|uniref:nitric oxide dioxygenase n=1 Tax=Cordyceps fumosorosea (strain ARSEF 2679) TaxID=1081104 RepID=A0A168BN42_CORFA|nr:flavohemoprotein [Cordyceps fumosorosea ARSEF 2679]OAA70330.1 flavohemoprotein [Cordyceps fumosorosea ARSEF 2679]